MRCHYCIAGEMRPGTTAVTLKRQGVSVMIYHVQALVCDACGEAYVER